MTEEQQLEAAMKASLEDHAKTEALGVATADEVEKLAMLGIGEEQLADINKQSPNSQLSMATALGLARIPARMCVGRRF